MPRSAAGGMHGPHKPTAWRPPAAQHPPCPWVGAGAALPCIAQAQHRPAAAQGPCRRRCQAGPLLPPHSPFRRMLLLFESSAGFCLFKVLNEGKLKEAETQDVWSDFETPEKASKVRAAAAGASLLQRMQAAEAAAA